ncbi:MAG TPA: putative glycolipid-binding domain-containing protein [Longimicrobiaceae bacterium]
MTAQRPVEHPIPTETLADVLWRRLDRPSFEHCRVLRADPLISVQGCVLTVAEGTPLRVDYLVVCSPEWITHTANVHLTHGREHRVMELRRGDSGVWVRDGQEVPEMEGLIDIDLALTPATNTLPIRRLGLNLGEEAKVEAVWVEFPSLSLQRLAQQYTRTAQQRYLYQSRDGAFHADLDVDAEGVVVRYGNIWERVAPTP